MKPVVIITIAFVLLIPTAAFGLEFAEKSDGKNLAGAVIVVVVVLILSVVLANGIWDFTHDAGISNVEIELISCKKTASGSTQTVVKISNYNDHRVLVEWGTIGGFGYAENGNEIEEIVGVGSYEELEMYFEICEDGWDDDGWDDEDWYESDCFDFL